MPRHKYPVPDWLDIPQAEYKKWLDRKAAAHVRRDRKRCGYPITHQDYREKIHAAVIRQGQYDFYTGEALDWSLIGTYCNEASKAGRARYKAGFALLPTVDHVDGADGEYDFAICGWRTNNAKADLDYAEFTELCRRVIDHANAAQR